MELRVGRFAAGIKHGDSRPGRVGDVPTRVRHERVRLDELVLQLPGKGGGTMKRLVEIEEGSQRRRGVEDGRNKQPAKDEEGGRDVEGKGEEVGQSQM